MNPVNHELRSEKSAPPKPGRQRQGLLPDWTRSQIARWRRRLRLHGLLKPAGKTCKSDAPRFGQRIFPAGLKLKEHVLLPALATAGKGAALGLTFFHKGTNTKSQ